MSKILSAWEQYKEKNGVTPLDMLNPKTKRSDEELYKYRIDICMTCPELIQLTTQCKKCGCFMNFKTKLLEASCPIGKW